MRRAGRRRYQTEISKRVVSNRCDRSSVDFDSLVEATHPRLIDPTTQLGESDKRLRHLGGEPWSDERGRLVRRKEMSVVVEDDEVVSRDQSVSRIAVDDVDLPCGERLIFHRRTEDANIGEMQAVRALKSRETIRASNEISRQSRPHASARRREIRERFQVQRISRRTTHRDGVTILKS